MPEELNDEERALLEKHRAEKKRAAEEDKEVWIRQGDNEAALPYSKVRSWVQRIFQIDLDEEPVQDAPEPESKPKVEGEGGQVKRFVSGRRVG